MSGKKKINPHCPVSGCRTTKAHADDQFVKALLLEIAAPERMAIWAAHAMEELRDSICRDIAEGKTLSWHARLRQPEELYIKTLYCLFIATSSELDHILSGEVPNGLSSMYDKVNQVIFEARGTLKAQHQGLFSGAFTPMETLNDGAHVSFRSVMTSISLRAHPEYVPPDLHERYSKHLSTYVSRLNYIHGMFKAGRTKADVLNGMINLHRQRRVSTAR
jgi:hypothetical protein